MLRLKEGYTVYKAINKIGRGHKFPISIDWIKSRMTQSEAEEMASQLTAETLDEFTTYSAVPDLEYYGYADPIRWLDAEEYKELYDIGDISKETYYRS